MKNKKKLNKTRSSITILEVTAVNHNVRIFLSWQFQILQFINEAFFVYYILRIVF